MSNIVYMILIGKCFLVILKAKKLEGKRVFSINFIYSMSFYSIIIFCLLIIIGM